MICLEYVAIISDTHEIQLQIYGFQQNVKENTWVYHWVHGFRANATKNRCRPFRRRCRNSVSINKKRKECIVNSIEVVKKPTKQRTSTRYEIGCKSFLSWCQNPFRLLFIVMILLEWFYAHKYDYDISITNLTVLFYLFCLRISTIILSILHNVVYMIIKLIKLNRTIHIPVNTILNKK